MKINFIQNLIDLTRGKISCKDLKITQCIFYYISFFHYINIKKNLSKKIKKNEKLQVCFMGYQDANNVDVFTNLYQLIKNDKHFNVSVVIVPYTHDDKNEMINIQNKSELYLKKKNIASILGYNSKSDDYIDLYNKFDVVFFEIAYDWIPKQFSPENFPLALTYYIPYGQFLADNIRHHFSQKMMNQFYKIYPTSKDVAKMMKKYSLIKGININKFIGNPKNQKFFNSTEPIKNVWKTQSNEKKKIIWAPHHMWASYSNFLTYKDVFIELSKKYKDCVQFAFKPHPALKQSLISQKIMTKEEIDEYYKYWHTSENCQLEEGEWFNLFKTSDAMILDSIGFMLEYSLTGKPACVIYRKKNNKREMKFSKVGEKIFQLLYQASTKKEIENFIKEIVINNNDYKKNKRMNYIYKNYTPPDNNTAEINIYHDIKKDLKIC